MNRLTVKLNFSLIIMLLLSSPQVYAKEWFSVTLDNDLFIGNDNGYTNGIYFSYFDIGRVQGDQPSNSFIVSPLMWSMPSNDITNTVNTYMIGQTMNTPSDIEISHPDEDELPYSALLAVTNTYVVVTPKYTDRVSTTIGIVGPAALGEEAQKWVHDIVGTPKPQGWTTQLKNELVFQFSRGRIWQSWISEDKNFDLVTNIDLSLGTIQSAIGTGATFRYGKGLIDSYVTTAFNRSRTSNPSAVGNNWFIYSGLQAGYIFNQIFTDGNTFRDSRSINYKHNYIGLTAGIAYSFGSLSISFAVNNANIIQGQEDNKKLDNLTEYGTLSIGFRI